MRVLGIIFRFMLQPLRLLMVVNGGAGRQVLANSIVASVLILVHCYQLRVISSKGFTQQEEVCFRGDILVIGIIAYAAYASIPAVD